MNRAEIIDLLRHEYPDKNVTRARIMNLIDMTKDVPPDVLLTAVQQYMRTGKFFPKVSELFRLIDGIQAAKVAQAREDRDTWRYGRYRSDHEPMTDDRRYALEVELGLMRPESDIEAEIAEARKRLTTFKNPQRASVQL